MIRKTKPAFDINNHECAGLNCKCIALRKTEKVRSVRRASKSQEDRVAEQYRNAGFPRAKRVLGSGAFKKRVMIGDVDPEELLLVECKESARGTLRIDPAWVDQIEKEAREKDRPWFALHTWVKKDNQNYRKVVLTDERTWLDLLRQLKERD